MMQIGIVCEGPSDYPALEHFVGSALLRSGFEARFVGLFPDRDNTRPDGGWANVFSWLKKYPAESRVQRFFGGGLFGGALQSNVLDAIIVQLDADILEDQSFERFVKKNYDIELVENREPSERAAQVRAILERALGFDTMTSADCRRHILFPAVESTEAWCVSAFTARSIDANRLIGSELLNAFMICLESSEGRTVQERYMNIDKSVERRERFCQTFGRHYNRIERDCEVFARSLIDMHALAKASVSR